MSIIAYQIWLDLPQEIKDKIAKQFNLPRTGFREVMDNRIVMDYHTPQDVATLTCERLVAFTGIETEDIYKALNDTINKLNEVPKEESEPRPEAGQEVASTAVGGEKKAGGRGRPRKS